MVDSLRSAGKLFDLAGGGNKQHDEVSSRNLKGSFLIFILEACIFGKI